MVFKAKKVGSNEMVWDNEENCVLCKFQNGSIDVSNPVIQAKLKRLGYEAVSEPKEVKKKSK